MHSFFLIHLVLFLTNYQYRVPHSLFMSMWLSFLYGPILYFYFKRITLNYSFKRIDLLHLAPTFVLIAFLLPFYFHSGPEKLNIMMGRSALGESPFLDLITYLKFASLVIYGYLTVQLYIRKVNRLKSKNQYIFKPQRVILIMHSVYTLAYGIYGYLILEKITWGWFFNIQLLAMTAIVLYVGYMAYSNPGILSSFKLLQSNKPKYQNSGLTTSFSVELWEQLEELLSKQKLYRQNDLKLETIAELLGTTRHNASQLINEHSGLNFFKLINKYRIEEAKEILANVQGKLNIIDVAYEVGYNNKVTFNKSFKRFCKLTPSQYRKQLNQIGQGIPV